MSRKRVVVAGLDALAREVVTRLGADQRCDVVGIGTLCPVAQLPQRLERLEDVPRWLADLVDTGEGTTLFSLASDKETARRLSETQATDVVILRSMPPTRGDHDGIESIAEDLGIRCLEVGCPAAPGHAILGGINRTQDRPSAEHALRGAGSCAANAVAYVLRSIDDAFGIQGASVTIRYSAEADVLETEALPDAWIADVPRTDPRVRSRSLLVPLSTSTDSMLSAVLTDRPDAIAASALRIVHAPYGVVDIAAQMREVTDARAVNHTLSQASQESQGLKVLRVLKDEAPSNEEYDFTASQWLGHMDASLTQVSGDRLVRIVVYFNYGKALAGHIANTLLAEDS